MQCPACGKAFEPSATDAARATAVCPHCGRVVVRAERPPASAGDAMDGGTSPLLEPLPAHESPTQIGVASQTLSLPAKRVSVAVLSGPRKGEAFALTRPRLTFGRAAPGAQVDVAIDDPDLSAEHAALECHGSRIVLRDLGSRTGTFLGDERTAGAREVEDGAEFRLGQTTFLLLVQDP